MRYLFCLLIIGCAGAKTRQALAVKTDNFIIARSCNDVWPTVKQVLEDHGFPGFTKGDRQLHLETAMLTEGGGVPGASTTGGSAPMVRGQSASQRGMRGGPVDHAGSAVMRFIADGDVIDEQHCRVRVVRHLKDNIDASETDVDRDPYMELDVISRLEPDRAEEIRQALKADGIDLQ